MDKMLLSLIILVCHIFIFVFYFHFLFPSVPHLPVADWCFLPLMIAFDRDLSYKQSLQEKKPISGRMAHLQIATASSSSCLSFPSLQPLLCLEYTYSYTSLQGVSLSHQAGSIDLPFSGLELQQDAFWCHTWVGGAGGCVWLCRGCSVSLDDTVECLFTSESCGLIFFF